VSENGDKRPWLAAVLAVVYPGLGHVYLGLWWRAVVWSGMAGLAVAAFVPGDAVSIVRTEGVAALAVTLGTTAAFVLASVTAMAAFDAYWHATRGVVARTGETACPDCGKAVDQEIGFCQWCTAELE
jgi:hypothetical protein